MGCDPNKSELWKIYHTEYAPFFASDWLETKQMGGAWATTTQFNIHSDEMTKDTLSITKLATRPQDYKI